MRPLSSSAKTYSPFPPSDFLSYSCNMDEAKRKSMLDVQIGAFVKGELARRGLSEKPFALSVGIDDGQFRRLLKGQARWNTYHMDVVAAGLGLSPKNLLAGTLGSGPLISIPMELACPTVLLVSDVDRSPEIPLQDYYAAPLIDGEIAAGDGRIIGEGDIRSLVWIYAPELRDRRHHSLIAVEVAKNEDGESMMPVLFPGDIVLVDTDDPRGEEWKFKEGAIYAVRTGRLGDCSIKRVYKDKATLILASDNRARRPQMAWTDRKSVV